MHDNVCSLYRIESVQKRSLKIIYGHGDYSDICAKQGLPTLASRRTEICTSFFNNSVLKKNSCLHYLFPRPRRKNWGDHCHLFRRLPEPLDFSNLTWFMR